MDIKIKLPIIRRYWATWVDCGKQFPWPIDVSYRKTFKSPEMAAQYARAYKPFSRDLRLDIAEIIFDADGQAVEFMLLNCDELGRIRNED